MHLPKPIKSQFSPVVEKKHSMKLDIVHHKVDIVRLRTMFYKTWRAEMKRLNDFFLLRKKISRAKWDLQYKYHKLWEYMPWGSMWTDTSSYLWWTPRGCSCVLLRSRVADDHVTRPSEYIHSFRQTTKNKRPSLSRTLLLYKSGKNWLALFFLS